MGKRYGKTHDKLAEFEHVVFAQVLCGYIGICQPMLDDNDIEALAKACVALSPRTGVDETTAVSQTMESFKNFVAQFSSHRDNNAVANEPKYKWVKPLVKKTAEFLHYPDPEARANQVLECAWPHPKDERVNRGQPPKIYIMAPVDPAQPDGPPVRLPPPPSASSAHALRAQSQSMGPFTIMGPAAAATGFPPAGWGGGSYPRPPLFGPGFIFPRGPPASGYPPAMGIFGRGAKFPFPPPPPPLAIAAAAPPPPPAPPLPSLLAALHTSPAALPPLRGPARFFVPPIVPLPSPFVVAAAAAAAATAPATTPAAPAVPAAQAAMPPPAAPAAPTAAIPKIFPPVTALSPLANALALETKPPPPISSLMVLLEPFGPPRPVTPPSAASTPAPATSFNFLQQRTALPPLAALTSEGPTFPTLGASLSSSDRLPPLSTLFQGAAFSPTSLAAPPLPPPPLHPSPFGIRSQVAPNSCLPAFNIPPAPQPLPTRDALPMSSMPRDSAPPPESATSSDSSPSLTPLSLPRSPVGQTSPVGLSGRYPHPAAPEPPPPPAADPPPALPAKHLRPEDDDFLNPTGDATAARPSDSGDEARDGEGEIDGSYCSTEAEDDEEQGESEEPNR